MEPWSYIRPNLTWPGCLKLCLAWIILSYFEQTVYDCEVCQGNCKEPPTVPLHPWPWPTLRTSWESANRLCRGFLRVHVLSSDRQHSKWLEVVPMKSTTTKITLQVLRFLFAHYGLPKQLVSDNGPQFTAREFGECVRANGFNQECPIPFGTNGEAERFIQTFNEFSPSGKE